MVGDSQYGGIFLDGSASTVKYTEFYLGGNTYSNTTLNSNVGQVFSDCNDITFNTDLFSMDEGIAYTQPNTGLNGGGTDPAVYTRLDSLETRASDNDLKNGQQDQAITALQQSSGTQNFYFAAPISQQSYTGTNRLVNNETDLDIALASCVNGDKISIGANFNVTSQRSINRKIKVEGGGYTITASVSIPYIFSIDSDDVVLNVVNMVNTFDSCLRLNDKLRFNTATCQFTFYRTAMDLRGSFYIYYTNGYIKNPATTYMYNIYKLSGNSEI